MNLLKQNVRHRHNRQNGQNRAELTITIKAKIYQIDKIDKIDKIH